METRLTIIFILVLFAISRPAKASSHDPVWQLGSFDQSSAEFADGVPSRPVTFVIGQDHPDKNWYAYAAAAFPSVKPNLTSAPRAIQFSMNGVRSPAYRLSASLIIEHSSVPALRVDVNGHAGMFYLHPKLD